MTAQRLLAGVLLAALGCFMASLAMSRAYWFFLNPRFSWLTLAAGCLLVLLGLCLMLDRTRRVSLAASLALFLFLPLAWLAVLASTSDGPAPASLTLSTPGNAGPPELLVDGTPHLRLNPAELLLLADKEGGPDPRPFATEGFVLRTPELDAAGEVVLVRLVINCCFADALAAGVRVRVPDPVRLDAGLWYRMAGRLVAAAPLTAPPPPVAGVIATVLAESALLHATLVESTQEPEAPYVFEIRAAPPFAY